MAHRRDAPYPRKGWGRRVGGGPDPLSPKPRLWKGGARNARRNAAHVIHNDGARVLGTARPRWRSSQRPGRIAPDMGAPGPGAASTGNASALAARPDGFG